MSQIRLAKEVGLSQPSLSQIEKGITTPTRGTLTSLARALSSDFEDASLAHLFVPASDAPWEAPLRPLLHYLRQHEYLLDVIVLRLAQSSDRFRALLSNDTFENVKYRAEQILAVVEASNTQSGNEDIGGEVSGIEPLTSSDVMLAPVVAHIGPGVNAEDPKDEVRRMINEDEVNEIERRLKPRKRKAR